jgi:hypothetical protein
VVETELAGPLFDPMRMLIFWQSVNFCPL